MLKILVSNTPPSWIPFHAQLARIPHFPHFFHTVKASAESKGTEAYCGATADLHTPHKRNFRPTLGQTPCFYFPVWVTQKTRQEEKPHRFQQTPTAMDPEDVATNTLITILTVGKRAPPNTPP